MKKLHLISQLHITEQSWSKTAEHCSLYLSSKVTMHFLFLNIFYCIPFKNAKTNTWLFVTIASIALWLWHWHPAVGHRELEYHHGVYWVLERAADCFHVQAEEDWASSAGRAQWHPARHRKVAPLLHSTKQVRASLDSKRDYFMFLWLSILLHFL